MLVYPFEETLSWSYNHHTPYLLNMMTLTKIYAQKAGAKEQTRIITDKKLCGGADSVIISEFSIIIFYMILLVAKIQFQCVSDICFI